MKKRILFMHHISSIGGASYCLLNILKSLNRCVFEPIVLLKQDGPLRDEIEKLGIKTEVFPLMNTIPYNKPIYQYHSFKKYIDIEFSMSLYVKLLKKINADIVYLNNMMLYPYLKPAKKLGLSTLIHIREHWPLDEHTKQLRRAQNYVKQYADHVIAINRYSANIFPDSLSTIIYDWIDMENRYEYRPFTEIFREDTSRLKVYLYTGGMLSIKGTIQVIDAFMNSVSDQDARLLIVGIDSNNKISSLKSRIKKLLSKIGYDTYEYAVLKRVAKDKRIYCIPATYNLSHIMEQAYANLSFFTIPHANLALAECEIMGTPSVAARTDESMEYSLGEKLSILYEFGNENAFQTAVKLLDSKYEELRINIDKNKHIIRDMFSKTKNQAKLNSVLCDFK